MSNAKHTPGPWGWVDGNLVALEVVDEEVGDYGVVLSSWQRTVVEGYAENPADRCLLATAPDLLAECEAALQFIVKPLREECARWQATAEATQQFVDTHERVQGLRDVIAKAKGAQNANERLGTGSF